MDWNSRRITAVLENALLEDRATRDATSYACIDPNQRATGTVIAGAIDAALLAEVRDFIALNREALTDYWEYRIDTTELQERLRKIA